MKKSHRFVESTPDERERATLRMSALSPREAVRVLIVGAPTTALALALAKASA